MQLKPIFAARLSNAGYVFERKLGLDTQRRKAHVEFVAGRKDGSPPRDTNTGNGIDRQRNCRTCRENRMHQSVNSNIDSLFRAKQLLVLMDARLSGMVVVLPMGRAMIGHWRGRCKQRADVATSKTLRGGGNRQNQTQGKYFESQCHCACGSAILNHYNRCRFFIKAAA